MTGGLLAGYGAFAAMAVRYLYPSGDPEQTGEVGWQFVTTVDGLPSGAAIDYTAPSGAKVVVARHGEGETAEAFIALSSVCPHLGCQVHWEPQNDRFFCPCHNGAFDRQGRPIAGPPKAGNQPLTQFPIKVEAGLVFVEAPLRRLGDGAGLADCRQCPHALQPESQPPTHLASKADDEEERRLQLERGAAQSREA